ncbi:hypothetical protein F5H01DRAFT_331619 [Linnemannia elongata]|nr:hypothetical protein F5H01DRAFT_331619 [Linnemannia elongata]
MSALVAFNAYLLSLVARNLIQYDDPYDDDEDNDDDPVEQPIPHIIFIPGILFDIRTLSPKKCVEQFRFRPRHIPQL